MCGLQWEPWGEGCWWRDRRGGDAGGARCEMFRDWDRMLAMGRTFATVPSATRCAANTVMQYSSTRTVLYK